MAPPKKPKLSVKKQGPGLAEKIYGNNMPFAYIDGLGDAIAYHVGLTAKILEARLRLEEKKKQLRKNPIDPKTLKPIDPKAIKKQETWIKKVARAEADMVKVLGVMAGMEKDSMTLKARVEKEAKKGLTESALRRYMKEATARSKAMEKTVKEFKLTLANAEAGLQIISRADRAR